MCRSPSRYSGAAFSLCCMKFLGGALHIHVPMMVYSYHYIPSLVSAFDISVSFDNLF